MIKRLIIFLVRKRLGLKKNEYFTFKNQKTDNIYYFNEDRVIKLEPIKDTQKGICVVYFGKLYIATKSSVSLNWLLDDRCEICKLA